jgi:integrase
MMAEKPIELKKESEPGKNPKNGARPFTGEELAHFRKVTKHKNSGKQVIDDTSLFLLLRWTGLRVSDAVNLRWSNVHFGRGVNGEIEVLTQKRGKIAIVPLSTELRDDLEAIYNQRKPHAEDRLLFNPETGAPFTSRVY